MQQTSAANIFDVPTSNHSSNSNKQSFLHGKLIIHEEEPIIEEGDEDEQLITQPAPTQAMYRERRQHKVSHSHFQNPALINLPVIPTEKISLAILLIKQLH